MKMDFVLIEFKFQIEKFCKFQKFSIHQENERSIVLKIV